MAGCILAGNTHQLTHSLLHLQGRTCKLLGLRRVVIHPRVKSLHRPPAAVEIWREQGNLHYTFPISPWGPAGPGRSSIHTYIRPIATQRPFSLWVSGLLLLSIT